MIALLHSGGTALSLSPNDRDITTAIIAAIGDDRIPQDELIVQVTKDTDFDLHQVATTVELMVEYGLLDRYRAEVWV